MVPHVTYMDRHIPHPKFPGIFSKQWDSYNLAPTFVGGGESIPKFSSMREGGRGEMTESPKHVHVNPQRRNTNLKVKFEAAGRWR